jgi:hypothetical protein
MFQMPNLVGEIHLKTIRRKYAKWHWGEGARRIKFIMQRDVRTVNRLDMRAISTPKLMSYGMDAAFLRTNMVLDARDSGNHGE